MGAKEEIAKFLAGGPARRDWLERQDAKLGNTMRYYLGPAANPVEGIARLISGVSPGADMMDMYQSGGDLMQSKTPAEAGRNLGWLGASSLGMFVPGNASALRDELAGLQLYHGTPNADVASGKVPLQIGPTERRTDFGNFGEAIYGSPKEFIAKAYSEKGGRRGGVVPFKAPLQNPLYVQIVGPEYTKEIESLAKELGVKSTPVWEGSGQRNAEFAREFRERAMAAGYDGVVALDDEGKIGAEVAVFDENLIRTK